MAAVFNRGSEGLGIDKPEVEPEFLSAVHDVLIRLPQREST